MQRAARYVKPHHLANDFHRFEGLNSKERLDAKDESIIIFPNVGNYLTINVV
jgi:hypothetical protein